MAANHYVTLGVAPHSPREVIRAAYLRLMRRYHPDKNPSEEAAARVREITAAYAVLSVAEARARYDERQRERRAVPRPAPQPEWKGLHRTASAVLVDAGAAISARLHRAASAGQTAGGAMSAGLRRTASAAQTAGGAIWAWLPRAASAAQTAGGAMSAGLHRTASAAPIAAGTAVRGLRTASAALIAGGAAIRAPLQRAALPALTMVGVAVLALVAYFVPAWVVPEKGFERSSVGGKTVISASLPKPFAAAVATENDATLCSTEVASQSITRELFRRATLVAGSNSAALERILASSLVRFASPAVRYGAQGGEVISCRARVVLHLPPGVTAPGGRQSLDGVVAYSLRGGDAGGPASLSLTAEPAMVRALAFLTQTSSEAAPDLQPPIIAEALPTVIQPAIVPAPTIVPTPKIAPTAAVVSARVAPVPRPKPEPRMAEQAPSFSCSGQKSWAEKAVCMSANLAALDRAMSSLWGDSMARANARQRASLLASDRRFLASRAQCASEACVREAYLVGTDDIRSIMYTAPAAR